MTDTITLLENLTKEISNYSFHWSEVKKIFPPLIDFSIIDRYGNFLKALISCRKTAESEYQYIQSEMIKLESLHSDVNDLMRRLNDVEIRDTVSVGDEVSQEQVATVLKKTAEMFADSFRETISGLKEKNAKLGEELKDFKLVLFGRTKVGKSTVREALTKGNGSTIGKGGQSTTLEVNQYSWYNLKVYDTPGTLSVKDTDRDPSGIGEEERKALELLLRADISLFMFATDNIETAELEYLRKIAGKGKDILVLLNVKSDMSDYRKFLLRKKNLEISLERQAGHVNRIREAEAGKPFDILPIHAQAGFYSRAGNNSAVELFYKENQISRTELYELSNFASIRDCLVQNIEKHGLAIRAKTIREFFISNIREFAAKSQVPIDECVKQNISFLKLLQKTQTRIEKQIADFSDGLSGKVASIVRTKIDTYDFASDCIEYKYSKDQISNMWKEKLECLSEIQKDIVSEFIDEIRETVDEMVKQMDFIIDTDSSFAGFEMSEIPWKGLFQAGGILVGAGTATAIVLGAIPVFGWAALGLGLLAAGLGVIAGWFKSKETKIRELEEKLDSCLDQAIDSIRDGIIKGCEEKLFPSIRNKFSMMIDSQKLLIRICNNFSEINGKFFEAADKNEKLMNNKLRELERGL